MRENERLKKEMQQVVNKEQHHQHVEILKQQNKISEERISLSQGHGTQAETNGD